MSELKLLLLPQITDEQQHLMLMLLYDYLEFYCGNSVFMGHGSIDLKFGKHDGYFIFSIFK